MHAKHFGKCWTHKDTQIVAIKLLLIIIIPTTIITKWDFYL